MSEKIAVTRISERPELIEQAAAWFHEKWKIPLSAYLESMRDAQKEQAVPEWYVVLEGEKIVGGLGVIENDFHERKDLAPNVCAVYVEESHRCRGIARELLAFASDDMKAKGIDTLYLVTSHTSLYERYGWQYHCPVKCDGGKKLSRMYIHKA